MQVVDERENTRKVTDPKARTCVTPGAIASPAAITVSTHIAVAGTPRRA
jgi:hypothetical protein